MTEMLLGYKFLHKAVVNGCSDIHFNSHQPVHVRKHGDIFPVSQQTFPEDDLQELLKDILEKKLYNTLMDKGEADFPYEMEGIGRFRGNAYKEKEGFGISFRVIPYEIPQFEDLHLPAVLKQLCHKEKGLVLVTGPTGSGKSTTLASMINYMNHTMRKKIVTLEDPIEFVYTNDKSTIVQRQIGVHTDSFYNGLRASLRQDPDIILVGEMRDLETIATAISAGETGHLVFATLHTTDATSTVQRIIDMFPSAQQGQIRSQLSTNLLAVVSQRLLRKQDGTGRVGAYEVLLNNPASQNLIRENKTFQLESVLEQNRQIGMCSMKESLEGLLNQGIVSQEEVQKHQNQTLFK